jgi:endonuclease III
VQRENKPEPKRTVRILRKHYGPSFAEELGIRLETNTPSALFSMLIAALLFSARIGHTIALKSARVLIDRGWTSAEKMARTTWEQRVRALDEGGYVRYDERTSTMLGETAALLLERYQGDLRKLREAAGGDPAAERKLIKQFKGIGEVGADIFFREAQLVWTELYPFADDRALATAKALGLAADARALAGLVRGRGEFVRLVDDLVRVRLDRKEDEIRKEVLAAASA